MPASVPTTIINNFGTVTGWAQIKAVLYGRTLVGISKLSYKDSIEREAVMGGGQYPIGTGDGNYKAECSMTLLKEEVDGIMASLPANSRIHDIPPADVSVLTVRNGKTVKDVIRNFQFSGQGREVSQGDKAVWLEMPCFCTHIDYNVQ
ncbi:MAG: hypothetical protein JSR70_00920 [Proteobacteria bacterium]|nr:hypothetical protein [Pseudomonadota bacterium]